MDIVQVQQVYFKIMKYMIWCTNIHKAHVPIKLKKILKERNFERNPVQSHIIFEESLLFMRKRQFVFFYCIWGKKLFVFCIWERLFAYMILCSVPSNLPFFWQWTVNVNFFKDFFSTLFNPASSDSPQIQLWGCCDWTQGCSTVGI